MRWVTRQNASVDRIACPWLIKRFIDPDAEFLYVPAADVKTVAEREGGYPLRRRGSRARSCRRTMQLRVDPPEVRPDRPGPAAVGADRAWSRRRCRRRADAGGGGPEGDRAWLCDVARRSRPSQDRAGNASLRRPLCMVPARGGRAQSGLRRIPLGSVSGAATRSTRKLSMPRTPGSTAAAPRPSRTLIPRWWW